MNEIPRLSQKTEIAKESVMPEPFISEFGGIHTEGNHAYAITHNGEGVVPIPNDMAVTISLALRTQDKVYSGEYPHLAKRLALLNCRKSTFAVTGALGLADATNSNTEDINGVAPLLTDVERIQNEGFSAHIVTESNTAINELLNEYEGAFPAVVHVFEIDKNSQIAESVASNIQSTSGFLEKDLVEKMHRVHTFLVLGEDDSGYVCFQKMGPELNRPFTVSSLDEVVFPFQLSPGRESIVFIGPSR